MDSYLKRKQSQPGFELGSLCPFHANITITPRASCIQRIERKLGIFFYIEKSLYYKTGLISI